MPIPTLQDAKDLLNITTGDDDEMLNHYLGAAQSLVEARTGPLSVRSFTEVVTTRGTAFLLSNRPIVAIESITQTLDSWATATVDDLAFDGTSGVVYRPDLSSLAGTWSVTYTAGWASPKESWYVAVLVTCEHLWRSARGGSKRPTMGTNDAMGNRAATPWALPPLAQELVSDGLFHGGIA
jgi:hypothetical protein